MTMGANLKRGSAGEDDRLSRALAALRCIDVPAGPSAEVLAQTLAAMEATAKLTRPTCFGPMPKNPAVPSRSGSTTGKGTVRR